MERTINISLADYELFKRYEKIEADNKLSEQLELERIKHLKEEGVNKKIKSLTFFDKLLY